MLAQPGESIITNLNVVDLNHTKGKHLLFCIYSFASRSLQLDWANTNEIKQDINQR